MAGNANKTPYDSLPPMEGKNADETNLLEPGGREPAAYTSGPENTLKRDTVKHPSFGELGAKGFCGE